MDQWGKLVKSRVTWQYLVSSQSDIDIPKYNWDTFQGSFESDPIRIKVTAKTPKSGPTLSGNQAISAVIVPSKRTLYLGEAVVLTYKIYSRSRNIEFSEINLPKLERFWKQNVNENDGTFEEEFINGMRYFVRTIGEVVAFPQESGNFSINDFAVKGRRQLNFLTFKIL